MIDYKSTSENEQGHLSYSGNIIELLEETAFLIQEIYSSLKDKDEHAAELYKSSLILCIKHDESPVWK